MNSLLLDFATAGRFFARHRVPFAVVVLTMALTIGANTAVFSVLNAFLSGDLGIPDAGRVVVVPTTKEVPGQGRLDFSDAYPNYQLLRQQTHCFESLGTTLATDVNWEQPEDTRRLQGLRATASFFEVMRVGPVLGRLFTSRDEGPGAARVALISHALWQDAFAGDPNVIGRLLRLNGEAYSVVGVLPARFSQPIGTDIYLPFDLPKEMWTATVGARQLNTYARLASGVTVAAASAQLRTFAVFAQSAEPGNKDWSWRATPLRENLLSGADQVLWLVQAGAAVLLLLAVSNLVSILLAWAAELQRETAVRLALGATSLRLVRQFLVQSLLLVVIGGGLGVALARLSLPVLRHLNPSPNLAPFLEQSELDQRTLAFAAVLILGTGLIAGVAPAWQSRSACQAEALRAESRGATLSRGALRIQKLLVELQAGISVFILVGAGLAGVNFYRLSHSALGFATASRVVMQVQFPEPAYATHEKRAQLALALEQNLAREPTLERWGLGTTLPVGDAAWGGLFLPQLVTGEYASEPVVFNFRRVSPGYLSAMGVPLRAGRLISEQDRSDTPPVAIVSQALADKFWPGQNAIGRKMRRANFPHAPALEIVGVVGNVCDAGVGLPAGETVYVPFSQVSLRRAWIVLTGKGSPAETIAAGRRALRATEPGMAAYNIASLDDLAWQARSLPRLQITLLGVFAVIAIGIVALGSYGIMSQFVSHREKEMAIRAALGATGPDILRLVLLENARLAVIGVVAGLLAAGWIGSALHSRVAGFETMPFWPFPVVAVFVLFLMQAASSLPARRAARLNVAKALA